MKRWQIFLGILFLTLGFSTAASAGNVKIALTATFQDSITEVSPGKTQYVTRKVRITEKDILDHLGTVYALPTEGANLYFALDGTFRILDQSNSVLLHTVDPSILSVTPASDWIRQGSSDSNPGTRSRLKNFRDATFNMNVDANNSFVLNGLMSVDVAVTGTIVSYLYKIPVMGHGEFDGAACTLSGKFKAKLG